MKFLINHLVFYFAIIIIIIIIIKVYFNFVTINLCDDNGFLLSQLNEAIRFEEEFLKKNADEGEYWRKEYYEELTRKRSGHGNPDIERFCKRQYVHTGEKFVDSHERIDKFKGYIEKINKRK